MLLKEKNIPYYGAKKLKKMNCALQEVWGSNQTISLFFLTVKTAQIAH